MGQTRRATNVRCEGEAVIVGRIPDASARGSWCWAAAVRQATMPRCTGTGSLAIFKRIGQADWLKSIPGGSPGGGGCAASSNAKKGSSSMQRDPYGGNADTYARAIAHNGQGQVGQMAGQGRPARESGDAIAEIETEKAAAVVEAVDKGRIAKFLVPDGTEGVKINTPIALLDAGSDKRSKVFSSSQDCCDESVHCCIAPTATARRAQGGSLLHGSHTHRRSRPARARGWYRGGRSPAIEHPAADPKQQQ